VALIQVELLVHWKSFILVLRCLQQAPLHTALTQVHLQVIKVVAAHQFRLMAIRMMGIQCLGVPVPVVASKTKIRKVSISEMANWGPVLLGSMANSRLAVVVCPA